MQLFVFKRLLLWLIVWKEKTPLSSNEFAFLVSELLYLEYEGFSQLTYSIIVGTTSVKTDVKPDHHRPTYSSCKESRCKVYTKTFLYEFVLLSFFPF